MLFRFAVLASLLLTSSAEEALPLCPAMTMATIPKYHQKCNRVAQNSEERRRQRKDRHDVLQSSHAYSLIPTQHTVVCPIEPVDLTTSGVVGQDSRWMVENKSSGRIVIAYWKGGVEYSAMNPKVTPPQSDTEAILQPGEFKVIRIFEGHIFYVREILEDGTVGDVLLQHRAGVVEFRNRFGRELESGSSLNDGEREGSKEVAKGTKQGVHHGDSITTTKSSSEFGNDDGTSSVLHNTNTAYSNKQRSPPNKMEYCNMIYQGFRNAVGIPLDIYYAGVEQDILVADGPMQCAEKFKLHLGNASMASPFDWKSSLKYEAAFIGHTFVARLASNPNVVVDKFTLQPTEIHDCPRRKLLPMHQEIVIGANGIQNGSANRQNMTEQLLTPALGIDSLNGTWLKVLSS